MAILRVQYGFNATARMYKQRLKAWGFRKNCNMQDVQRLARYRLKRKAMNETSMTEDMVLEGIADQQKILTYVKRKCWRSESSRTPLLRYLGGPRDLEGTEIMLANISNYIIGSFENGSLAAEDGWINNNGDSDIGPMEQLHRCLSVYISMLRNSDSCRAGPLLLEAFALVKPAVCKAEPETLAVLFSTVLTFREEIPEVVRYLLQHFSQWATFLLPQHHPLTQTLKQLALLEDSIAEIAIIQAWRNLLDQVERFVGPTNLDQIISRGNFTLITDPANQDVWLALIKRLNSHPLARSKDMYDFLRIVSMIIKYKWNSGILDEIFESETLTCISLTSQYLGMYHNVWIEETKADCLLLLAQLYYSDGRAKLAEQCQRQYIEALAWTYGRNDPEVVKALLTLERWLIEWDNMAELTLVRSRIQKAVDELATQNVFLDA
ncbi:hypothetical protein F5884DRAFT_548876 [Xylogone sp. PMI_703]|nr:hypothetical protein F5884DRAFT_548876 [Xylogone sp. PMI_703]